MKISADTLVKAGMLAAVIGVLYVARRDAQQLAAEVGTAINPVSQENLISRGVNAVVDALDDGNSGNDSNSFGTWLYRVIHGPAVDQAGATPPQLVDVTPRAPGTGVAP